MGIFDWFDKNKKSNSRIAPKTVTTIGTADEIFGKTPIVTKRTDKDIAVEAVMKKVRGGGRKEGSGTIIFPNGFEITILSIDSNKHDSGGYSCVLTIFVAMPGSESLICEKYLGRGDTKESAIMRGAEKFSVSFERNLSSHTERDTDIVENHFDGYLHTYRIPRTSFVISDGMENLTKLSVSLLSYVNEYIEDYLGSKKYYWLHIIVSCDEGELTAECYINGVKCEELSQLVFDGVKDKIDTEVLSRYMQDIIIVQDDNTYEKKRENYSNARNDYYKYVRSALPIMGDISDQDDYESIFAKIENAVGDKNAAWELMTFLPEVYTEMFFGIKCTHMINMKLGDKLLRLHEIHIEPISVFRNEVESFLEENKPTDQFNANVFALSSRYQAVAEAAEKGISDEKFAVGDLNCEAPENYEIW